VTPAAQEKGRAAAICLALAAATLAAFWGARQCQFVNFDDPEYITSNADVQQGLTWQSVRWAFRTGAAANWHPLTWLSHLLDFACYGLSPAGHHLTSVLLHAASGVLLFLILRAMTAAPWRSALVAALFALHPLRVESVAWVSERKDVLSTFFWMLSVWNWLRYAQECKVRSAKWRVYYGMSLLFFALGLMSKPMLVTLPLVLLLLDYWPLERWQRGLAALVREKIPFFVLAAASSIVTFLVQRHGGAVSSSAGVPMAARLGNALISYVRYLAKIFWPARLSPFYPHPGYWPAWKIAGAVVLLAAVTAWVIWRGRSQPYLAVGWFWFLGMLAPAIGLMQVGMQSMADRYSYVPSIGILIMVVWGASEWLRARTGGPWVLGIAGGLALGACLVLTPRQVSYWRTSETIFLHAADVTENNFLAYNNLGFDLSKRGEMEKALAAYRHSLAINSNYDVAHYNLGFALATLGRYQESTNEYFEALKLNPNMAEAHNGLAIALGGLGLADAGLQEFQAALDEEPDAVGFRDNYGIALARKGKIDDAVEQFRLAAQLAPNDLVAHRYLGNILAVKGDLVGGIHEDEFCLGIDPKNAQVHNDLANALAQQGRLDKAVAHYRTTLDLNPQNPEAHFNLSQCLIRLGRRAEAEEQCAIALQQRPDYPEARRQWEIWKGAK
jgi:tetratricopeptide (TPR) repeat protein